MLQSWFGIRWSDGFREEWMFLVSWLALVCHLYAIRKWQANKSGREEYIYINIYYVIYIICVYLHVLYIHILCLYIYIYIYGDHMQHDSGLYSSSTSGKPHKACPRMCLHTVLNEVADAFNLMAPVCGSWSAVSRGSTYRSYCNPMGHQPHQAVSFGNRMMSRFSGCSLMALG